MEGEPWPPAPLSLPAVYLPLPSPQLVAGSAKEKVTGTAEPGMVSMDRDPEVAEAWGKGPGSSDSAVHHL